MSVFQRRAPVAASPVRANLVAGSGHFRHAYRVEEQAIRFTAAGDRRIAWASSGSGPPLVFSGFWMSHLELNWRDPRFRAYIGALARHRTVIRYDSPGTGLSADGPLPTGDLDAEAAALAAVVEAAGADQVDLFAGSSGAPTGAAFAAANPEAVRRLLFYGGYAAGTAIADERSRRAIVGLVREHWGLGSRALADVFIPSATAAEREEFVEFQRQAASAGRAAASLEAVYRLDATDRLGQVPPGAVVLHRRHDRAIPLERGRELAAGLPDATFVALEGDDHFPWFGDPGPLLEASLRALEVEEEAAPLPRREREPERPRVGDSVAGEHPAASGGQSPDTSDLTKRETEVLTLVASGLSDREIADRLVLSPHTVHRHVANVRTKLGLPTRAAAVAAAAKRGLL
jgi:pimeloyl-ACP methyl ester carboxylesterase/DNA-binding CsgD family transcriptional regulator